jgi:carboxylesterase
MPQPECLDPSAYAANGDPVGALLIHGYTGSVAETRPMGEYLANLGLTVRCPLLPGHGTAPQDLTHIRWQVWAGAVESALNELEGRCETVFVAGLSLGSLLTLWLGAKHAEIAGLIPTAPAIRVQSRLISLTLGLRYLFKYNPLGPIEDDLGDPEAMQRIWCYDRLPMWGAGEVYLLQREARRALPRIHQPILIFQGRRDVQLHPQAAQEVYDNVASQDKTLIWLENSGHNVLADGERESVWARSYEWMMRIAGVPST